MAIDASSSGQHLAEQPGDLPPSQRAAAPRHIIAAAHGFSSALWDDESPGELRLACYSKSEGRFLTEWFAVTIDRNGQPLDGVQAKTAVFTSLMLDDDLFVVARIFRNQEAAREEAQRQSLRRSATQELRNDQTDATGTSSAQSVLSVSNDGAKSDDVYGIAPMRTLVACAVFCAGSISRPTCDAYLPVVFATADSDGTNLHIDLINGVRLPVPSSNPLTLELELRLASYHSRHVSVLS